MGDLCVKLRNKIATTNFRFDLKNVRRNAFYFYFKHEI